MSLAGCGLKTDLKIIVRRARKIAKNFSFVFGKQISANLLALELSTFFQEFTYSRGLRPFGLALFIAGFDREGPGLFQINPDGNIICIKANIIGKNALQGSQFLNRRWNANLNFEEIIFISFFCLKEATEGQVKSSDINVAVIDNRSSFKILGKQEVILILAKIDKFKK